MYDEAKTGQEFDVHDDDWWTTQLDAPQTPLSVLFSVFHKYFALVV